MNLIQVMTVTFFPLLFEIIYLLYLLQTYRFKNVTYRFLEFLMKLNYVLL